MLSTKSKYLGSSSLNALKIMRHNEFLFPQVYVDLDDVLAETAITFTEVLLQFFGKSVRFDEIFSFDLSKSFDLEPKELEKFMILAHDPSVLMSVQPIKGAVEVLESWKNRGAYITVVTGRPVSTHDISKEWLKKNKIPFDCFSVVDKYGHSKGDNNHKVLGLRTVLKYKFCFAIEDSARMAQFLSRHIGIPVALLDRPWNQRITRLSRELYELVVRCRDWTEIDDAFRSRQITRLGQT